MSCSRNQGTGPINVTQTSNTCDADCKYVFDYKSSQLLVENKGDYMKLSYDNPRAQMIKFRSVDYSVQEIRIYSQSLNKYNGAFFPCEIIIHHISANGDNLLVCIPVEVSNKESSLKTLFSKIITHFPRNRNDPKSINEPSYNLNHIVPRGGYYTYKGTVPYQPCTGEYDIILFDPAIAPNITSTDFNKLRPLIRNISSSTNVKEVGAENIDLYYNKNGTTDPELVGENNIYIDCRPVNEEGRYLEEIDQERKGSGMNMFKLDFDPNINPTQGIVIGSAVGFSILLIVGFYFARRKLFS